MFWEKRGQKNQKKGVSGPKNGRLFVLSVLKKTVKPAVPRDRSGFKLQVRRCHRAQPA